MDHIQVRSAGEGELLRLHGPLTARRVRTEQPARIVRIFNALQEAKLVERCERIKAREVERRELELVHTLDYVRKVCGAPAMPPPTRVHTSTLFGWFRSLRGASLTCSSLCECRTITTPCS